MMLNIILFQIPLQLNINRILEELSLYILY